MPIISFLVGFIYGDDDKCMMVSSPVFSDGLDGNIAGRLLGNRYIYLAKLCYMIDITCISEPIYIYFKKIQYILNNLYILVPCAWRRLGARLALRLASQAPEGSCA